MIKSHFEFRIVFRFEGFVDLVCYLKFFITDPAGPELTREAGT